MKMTARVLMIMAVLCLFVSLGYSEKKGSETPKQQDIRKLLKLSGSGELGKQVASQMMAQFKPAMPQVPAAFWNEFEKEINADDLIDLIVPIYDQHFTHEDVKALIAFYETPVGKKFISKMPVITQQSMQVGQQWGRQLGQRVIQKLQEKGYR